MQDKKEVYIKENKLAVVCCFKCLHGAFIKDPSNKKYENLSYVSFIRRIPKNVILPVKKTDLCELGVFAKKKLKQRILKLKKKIIYYCFIEII